MSKSLKNFFTLNDIEVKGFSPLDLRYLFLTAHYRSQLNFTWQGLEAAKSARHKMNEFILSIKGKGKVNQVYKDKFLEKINNDLDLPGGLAIIWLMIKNNNISEADKKATLLDFDKVLGLNLAKVKKEKIRIPKEVEKLVKARETARKKKDFKKSDELRDKISKLGYLVEDTDKGSVIKKK
jgi:cysteinyl-tRNA synthetase